MKLFGNEKRTELIKIKVKPSILKKTNDLWFLLYPHSEVANLDDLFQEMIVEACRAKNLITVEDLPQELQEQYRLLTSAETKKENDDMLIEGSSDPISNILG